MRRTTVALPCTVAVLGRGCFLWQAGLVWQAVRRRMTEAAMGRIAGFGIAFDLFITNVFFMTAFLFMTFLKFMTVSEFMTVLVPLEFEVCLRGAVWGYGDGLLLGA